MFNPYVYLIGFCITLFVCQFFSKEINEWVHFDGYEYPPWFLFVGLVSLGWPIGLPILLVVFGASFLRKKYDESSM